MNKLSILQHGRVFCLILLSFLAVNLEARAQNTARITLELKNIALKKALAEIEEQSSYLFFNQGVDLSLTVSVSVKNETIENTCKTLLTPLGVRYKIDGTQIYISKIKKTTLSGIVLDVSGLPVPGATVVEHGTSNGTMTDLDGKFSLTVVGNDGVLDINCLGYETKSITVGTRTVFSIVLQEESVALEGTVVTALGIRRDQKALSYNVQEVNAELLTAVKDANFINSLAGKVAGVTINSSSSGVGGAAKVVLRGNKSISQSSNALYVIDGVPMYNFGGGGGTEFDSKGATESIADLNPEDIQSISVLTGAAAAALYGSQAANGAVMITTKKGESGKLKASFSSNTEFLDPFILPEFQTSYGTGLNGTSGSSGIYSWGSYIPEESRYNYSPQKYFKT